MDARVPSGCRAHALRPDAANTWKRAGNGYGRRAPVVDDDDFIGSRRCLRLERDKTPGQVAWAISGWDDDAGNHLKAGNRREHRLLALDTETRCQLGPQGIGVEMRPRNVPSLRPHG